MAIAVDVAHAEKRTENFRHLFCCKRRGRNSFLARGRDRPDPRQALTPALVLNGVLIVALALGVVGLRELAPEASPFVEVAVMVTLGGLTYAICFLYLPLSRLEGESERWKRLLHLPARRRISSPDSSPS